jgi:hypothetical protein
VGDGVKEVFTWGFHVFLFVRRFSGGIRASTRFLVRRIEEDDGW